MRHALPRIAAILVLLLLRCVPLRAQEQAAAGSSAVTLRPGDMIRIEIWREEELSGEFLLDETGAVVLPLLGRREATHLPLDQLRALLLKDYQRELRNPAVTITPLRRIFVLGEVTKPGQLVVDPTLSIAGAVALAGGASPSGDLKRIRVVRNGEVLIERARIESPLASADVRSGDQIFVERRNWMDRNSTFLVSALLSITSIVVSILR